MSQRTVGAASPLRVSVIVPIWRDTENLALLLPKLVVLPGVSEVIVVNASRGSDSQRLAQRWGASYLKCSPPNRGVQMNVGAETATGDVLLFQHADTELRAEHLTAIQSAMSDRDVIGGAFKRKIEKRLTGMARSLLGYGRTLFGDQSVFVRRESFRRLGGFADYPMMEDIEFSKRLRRAPGLIALLDPPVAPIARPRRRREAGRKTWALFLYKCGVSPERLHRRYYPTAELPRSTRSSQSRARA